MESRTCGPSTRGVRGTAKRAEKLLNGLCTLRGAHLGDGQRRTPLCLENVEADFAIAVDVWVVDACGKGHLGRERERERERERDSKSKSGQTVDQCRQQRRRVVHI
jgi:hypothetical protein